MQIDKDPEVFKLLVGVVAFFAGILNVIGVIILNGLKSADDILFKKIADVEKQLSELQGEHNALCETHERRKKIR